jgi:hypothetical protein
MKLVALAPFVDLFFQNPNWALLNMLRLCKKGN